MYKYLLYLLKRGRCFVTPITNRSRTTSAPWSVELAKSRLRIDCGHRATGWYMLELCASLPRRIERATLSFSSSAENVHSPLCLRLTSKRLTKRLVYFPVSPEEIYLELDTAAGEIDITHLRITPVTRRFAKSRMLTKISRIHPSHRRENPYLTSQTSTQSLDLPGSAEELYAIYSALYENTQTSTRSYPEWIEHVEKAGLPSARDIDAFLGQDTPLPHFSIIVPVHDTPEPFLRACLDSICGQSYPHWELCIADDASPSGSTRQILTSYTADDSRIHAIFRETNGHISAASNSALQLATGDFVVFVDHDDLLPRHALFFLAQAIVTTPQGHLFYSDEDKIDEHGERFNPHFKSDWNPDLFFSHNYISHLCAIKRDLVEFVGGLRSETDGSQDYDLILRCLGSLNAANVVHIPRILYHWRATEGSTALDAGEKRYTDHAGLTALSAFFADHKAPPRIEYGPAPNSYRLHWPMPNPAPRVSLLIPTRNQKALLEKCITSILERTEYPNFEILILDNQSTSPEACEYLLSLPQKHAHIRVERYDHPFNYSAINNFGVSLASGDIFGLINNDIEAINPGWLHEMVSHAIRPDIGCVGAKLYYPDDTIQHAGVICSLGGVAGHSHKFYPRNHPGYFHRLQLVQNLSAVTAACLLVRRSVYEEVGGLDEANLKVAFNDVDFCLRVRNAGYRNLWTPYAELYHHESVSRGYEEKPENIKRFQSEIDFMKKTWGGSLERDPYYNPNLTRDREDFKL